MATKLSHSVLNASEEAIENPCSICKVRDKKDVESINYCVDCDSNICSSCTDFHANYPPLMSHKVVSISKASSARKTRVQLPTQKCAHHTHKLIERFCVDHQQLACDSCVTQDHRKCDNLEYIPVYSKGVKKSQELVATKTSTESALKALREFQSTQQETLQKLDTAELQCQQDLQDHRDKLVKRIDDLAKTDSAQIHSKFQAERASIKQSIKAVDDQVVTMEMIVKGLEQSKGDNEPELFVYMKQGEETEKESKQLLHIQQQSHKQISKYKFHSTIEKALGDVTALGEFEEAASLKPTSLKPTSLKPTSSKPTSLKPASLKPVSLKPASLKPVSLKLRGEYKVRAASDKPTCNITGACLLPDASVIIADWNNNSLKQLDSSYKVTRSLDMGTVPYGVCYTNSNNEVAVTLRNAKTVQFVSVGASLKKTRSFSVGDYYCWGITCSNGELFVCCESTPQSVQVYSLAGQPLRTIQHDPQGRPLFSNIFKITISSCSNKLHVTDGNKGVITTDRSGNLQQQFQDEDLSAALGICTLDNGDLLVCGYISNKVLHVSRDGRKLAVVLGQQDGLVWPYALVYDASCSRVIVTQQDCDEIKVFDVKLTR